MGRFGFLRNREDHNTDDEIEYYQPETGQTLQRASLHASGESDFEIDGSGGPSPPNGSKSVADRFRRSSVDLGRRLAGRLRSNRQSLNRISTGFTETDRLQKHYRDGQDADAANRGQRREHGSGRHLSCDGMSSAIRIVGGGGGGGGTGGELGASIMSGPSMLRSFANLFARSSISGDVQVAPGGRPHSTIISTTHFRNQGRRHSLRDSPSSSVDPSPEGTMTGMSGAASRTSSVVIVQPTKLLVPLEIRQRLLDDAAAAAAAAAAGADGVLGSASQFRNASLRHYLQEDGGGSGDGGGGGYLMSHLAGEMGNLYGSTAAFRTGRSLLGRPASGSPEGGASKESTSAQHPSQPQPQSQSQSQSRPPSMSQLQHPHSHYSSGQNHMQRHQLQQNQQQQNQQQHQLYQQQHPNQTSTQGGRRGGRSSGGRRGSDEAAGDRDGDDPRSSADMLLMQLQQQIAALRQMTSVPAVPGAAPTGEAAAFSQEQFVVQSRPSSTEEAWDTARGAGLQSGHSDSQETQHAQHAQQQQQPSSWGLMRVSPRTEDASRSSSSETPTFSAAKLFTALENTVDSGPIAQAAGGIAAAGDPMRAHPIHLSPGASGRSSPTGSAANGPSSPPTRLGRGTSRLKASVVGAFGLGSGSGSAAGAGNVSGASTEHVETEVARPSGRTASFSLMTSSDLQGGGSRFSLRARSSKAALRGGAVTPRGGGSTSDLQGMGSSPVSRDDEVRSRKQREATDAGGGADMQRNPAAKSGGTAATLRKLRRSVGMIKIALMFKQSTADRKDASSEGGTSQRPDSTLGLRQDGASMSELSNMDLSPRVRRGRVRRSSIDGFRNFMSRSFAQKQRRRSLDREQDKSPAANRFYDTDSDEEDDMGRVDPTAEPAEERGIPVPPLPRSSFEYIAEQDAVLPWSAQSSRASSIDDLNYPNRNSNYQDHLLLVDGVTSALLSRAHTPAGPSGASAGRVARSISGAGASSSTAGTGGTVVTFCRTSLDNKLPPAPLAPGPSAPPSAKPNAPAMSHNHHHQPQPSRFAPKVGGVTPTSISASPTDGSAAQSPLPPPSSAVGFVQPPPPLEGTFEEDSGPEAGIESGGEPNLGSLARSTTHRSELQGQSLDFLMSSGEVRRAAVQKRTPSNPLMLLVQESESRVSLEITMQQPMTSDLDLEDLIQAISHSNSTVPGTTPEGMSRRGTGTGSANSAAASGSLHRHRRGTSGSGGGGPSFAGGTSTFQVVVVRSGEVSSSPNEELHLDLDRESPSEACPIESSPPNSPDFSPPATTPRHHRQPQQPQQPGHSDSQSPREAQQAQPQAHRGEITISRDLPPITEQASSGKAPQDLNAHPVLQEFTTAWQLHLSGTSVQAEQQQPPPLPPPQRQQQPTQPQPQELTQVQQGRQQGHLQQGRHHHHHQQQRTPVTLDGVQGGPGAPPAPGVGVSKTVQVLLQKLNALPPGLRAEIIKQLSDPEEVRSLLTQAMSPGVALAPTAAATVGSTSPATPGPRPEIYAADSAPRVVGVQAPVNTGTGRLMSLLSLNRVHRNTLTPDVAPVVAGDAVPPGPGGMSSHPIISARNTSTNIEETRSSPNNPGILGNALALFESLTSLRRNEATATTANAVVDAATKTATGAAGGVMRTTQDFDRMSPSDSVTLAHSESSTAWEAARESRGLGCKASRKVLQPSDAFLAGKVDCSALTVAVAAAKPGTADPAAAAAAALQAAGRQSTPPGRATAATATTGAMGGADGGSSGGRVMPTRYRPSGKNTYQPTSTEVSLAKSIGVGMRSNGGVGVGVGVGNGVGVSVGVRNGVVEGHGGVGGLAATTAEISANGPTWPMHRLTAEGAVAAVHAADSRQYSTSAAAVVAASTTAPAAAAAAAAASTFCPSVRGQPKQNGAATGFGAVGGMDALLERLAADALKTSDSQVPEVGSLSGGFGAGTAQTFTPPQPAGPATLAAAGAAAVAAAAGAGAGADKDPFAGATEEQLLQLQQLRLQLQELLQDEGVAKHAAAMAAAAAPSLMGDLRTSSGAEMLVAGGGGGDGGGGSPLSGSAGSDDAAVVLGGQPQHPHPHLLAQPQQLPPIKAPAPHAPYGSSAATSGGQQPQPWPQPPLQPPQREEAPHTGKGRPVAIDPVQVRPNSPARFISALLRSVRSPSKVPTSPSESRRASAAGFVSSPTASTAASKVLRMLSGSAARSPGRVSSSSQENPTVLPNGTEAAAAAVAVISAFPGSVAPHGVQKHLGAAALGAAAGNGGISSGSSLASGVITTRLTLSASSFPRTGGPSIPGQQLAAHDALTEPRGMDANLRPQTPTMATSTELEGPLDVRPTGLLPVRVKPDSAAVADAAASGDGAGGGATATADGIAIQLQQVQRLQWQLLEMQREQGARQQQYQGDQPQQQRERQQKMGEMMAALRQQQQMAEQQQRQLQQQLLEQQQQRQQRQHSSRDAPQVVVQSAWAAGEAEVLDVPSPDLSSWQPLPLPPPAGGGSKYPTAPVPPPFSLQDIIPPGYTVVNNDVFNPQPLPPASPLLTAAGLPTVTAAAAAGGGCSGTTPAPAMVFLQTGASHEDGSAGGGGWQPTFGHGGGSGGGGGGVLSSGLPPGATMAPDGVHYVMSAMVVVDARALSPERLSPRWSTPRRLDGSGGGGGGGGGVYGGWPGAHQQAHTAADAPAGHAGSRSRGVSKAHMASHPLMLDDWE